MNFRSILSFLFLVALSGATLAEIALPPTPEVPYPEGYRQWRHVTSTVMPPKTGPASSHMEEEKAAAPHGLLLNIYANDQAVEGYRTGHFPEGAVLIADWFILEENHGALVQGARKSVDVMVRDARHTETGGWGFENFDKDSHTVRNVGPKAVTNCYSCHSHADQHEFVFSSLKP